MDTTTPAVEVARRRYSCRAYDPRPIPPELQATLSSFLASCAVGPLSARCRFALLAATDDDRSSLKGLGTYGFIRGAPGFIVGTVGPAQRDLEDYGYLLERIVLRATELELGTCWLGGTFTRSSFARAIAPTGAEQMPAVIAVGHAADRSRERDLIRRLAGSNSRLPTDALFFDGDLGRPLAPDAAGPFADALDAVRRAPSASNRQPWRLVRDGSSWHFFLARTPGYGRESLLGRFLHLADLQRVDLGIAMCHFDLAARERGQPGAWSVEEPAIRGEGCAYVATWRPAS